MLPGLTSRRNSLPVASLLTSSTTPISMILSLPLKSKPVVSRSRTTSLVSLASIICFPFFDVLVNTHDRCVDPVTIEKPRTTHLRDRL